MRPGAFRSWLNRFTGAAFTVDKPAARIRLISKTPPPGQALLDALELQAQARYPAPPTPTHEENRDDRK